MVNVQCFNVAVLIQRSEMRIGHTRLFALIDVGRALHHVQHGAQHFGAVHPVFRAFIAEAGDRTGLVVVTPV